MNERIKELAVAAAPVNSNIPHSEWNIPKEFIEKFAELIVKECVICAEREWIRNGSNTEHNQAVSKVIESIKQHFGVEE